MGERILIVDDRPENLRLLDAMLAPYGYGITTAGSGEEALRVIADRPPDLILLDVVMPGMSGYDVCRSVRASEATRYLPIVMKTATPDQDRVAGVEAGADDFVVEPFDKQELLARLRSLLRIKSYHDTIERQSAELAELNRGLRERVESQVQEILRLRGLGGTAVFRREGDIWTIAYEGSGFRLKDAKGLHYIAALLGEPGRERHALDLVASEPNDEGGAPHVIGDAGPILDAEAKAQYRARLKEIEEELGEAERWNDPERSARAAEERQLLAHELATAVGLGGRDRKAGSDAERARVNVTRAIKTALERIEEHSPGLARHLAETLRTGTFCEYRPDARAALRWEL